ncbi:MAG: adenosylmethionine--8-amino-7-oxononanoate transaminase [Planctomycetota bacterium]
MPDHDPASSHADLAALDRAHLWHPFTHMQQWMDDDPVVIVAGDGRRVQDANGNWYWDGHSSLWVNLHGHREPALDAAIRDQLDRVAHTTQLGLASSPAIHLAKRLSGMTGDRLSRVFLSDNGATAVEAALKIAVQYHHNRGDRRRQKILGFTDNYHGDTVGAMSVAPDDLFHHPFLGRLPAHPRAPYPNVYRWPDRRLDSPHVCAAALSETEKVIRAHADELAAIIVEPVEGAGGIIPAPPGFLRGLRELADRFGVLLIVDEVATGFGRTGRLFAWQADGDRAVPDLLCLGKGITGGYLPLAATLVREEIFREFLGEVDSGRTFFHGHSYTGNQLGCAVALASADLLEQHVLPTLPDMVAQISRGLERLAILPHVGSVRQAGTMVGIELVADKATRARFAYRHRVGELVVREARTRGMIIRPIGGTVIFMPPLASKPDELDAMLKILDESLRAAMPRLAELAAMAT